MPLDPKFVEMLICPACEDHPSLREDGDSLVCDRCHRAYAVTDNIPNLLPQEATIREK